MANQEELINLVKDYHDYNPPHVPSLPWPTPIQFSKQVSKGLPCVYSVPLSSRFPLPNTTNGIHRSTPHNQEHQEFSCPALTWTKSRFINLIGKTTKVEVAVTPDGRADSLHTVPVSAAEGDKSEQIFLEPATIHLPVSDFLSKLTPPSSSEEQREEVYYLQSQNSNLTTPSSSLGCLLRDIPGSIPFADSILGDAEAINVWIGDARSTTSTHRDPYENLYLVIKGRKLFTLWAPIEEGLMGIKMVRTGKYVIADGPSEKRPKMEFKIELSSSTTEKIPWVPVDPCISRDELDEMYPLYRYARPLTVTVNEGEMLYLPAGWFHHVSQDACGYWGVDDDDGRDMEEPAPCIAVNYWYDQDYEGEKFVMRQFLSRLYGVQ